MRTAPLGLRDMFSLLAELEDGVDLDSLLAGINWQGVSPQQVSHAALARLPQDLHYSGLTTVPFSAAGFCRALLLGPAFQEEIVDHLLAAFPEKQRRFFVHVPRSGGTSLGESLERDACAVPFNSLGPNWCGGEVFLRQVGGIVRRLPGFPALHVSGHYTLRSIVDRRLARFGDDICTSVRAPRDLILSFINYVLTVLEADPSLERPDTRAWAGELGLAVSQLQKPLAPALLRDLLGRMLRHDTLLPRDPLCHYLGDGTVASARDLLAAADVEIVDSAGLDQWRARQWGGAPVARANVSRRFFSWETLDPSARRSLLGWIRQDMGLYRLIVRGLAGGTSVRGLQLDRCAPRPTPLRDRVRIKRAERPILLDAIPGTTPVPGHLPHPGSARGGTGAPSAWAVSAPSYRTIETTLRLPTLQTRIRIRYARAPRSWRSPRSWLRGVVGRFAGLRQASRRI